MNIKIIFITAILVTLHIQIYAEIIIDKENITDIYSIGNTLINIHIEGTVDLGNPGTKNIWDFSNCNVGYVSPEGVEDNGIITNLISPHDTPYYEDFNNSNIVQYYFDELWQQDSWTYYLIDDTGFYNYGTVEITRDCKYSTCGYKMFYSPKHYSNYIFPLHIDQKWSSEDSCITIFDDGSTITTNDKTFFHVDASGEIILPNGQKNNALRIIREMITSPIPGIVDTLSTIIFISNSGESIDISRDQENIEYIGKIYCKARWSKKYEEPEDPGETSVINNDLGQTPDVFVLNQNMPNPFNNSTKISFQVMEKSYVSLLIYNIHGKRIYTIFDNVEKNIGNYDTSWDSYDNMGNPVSTGQYLIVLTANNNVYCRKLLLIK